MNYNNSRISLVLLLLVALAFALNLHGLAADSFWGDEIFTATFASRTPAGVIRWTAEDIHPPFYYLIAGIFSRLTVSLGALTTPGQPSDWLWRFPSVVAVVLTVAITYQLANYLSRPASYARHPTAIAAVLLLCLAPTAIKYGQEARMHALFMTLSALSTWLLFSALDRPRRWSRWLAYSLTTTANIYTMYFGFLVMVAQAGLVSFTVYDLKFTTTGYRLTTSKRRPTATITGFILATSFAFLLYLPWWPILFNILRRRAAVGAIEGGVGAPVEFLRGVVRALGPMPEPVAWGFLTLFIAGLIFLARQRRPSAAFAALWLALPVTLPIYLGDPRALQFRYAFILPIYLPVVAYAVINLSRVLLSRLPILQTFTPPIAKGHLVYPSPNLSTYLIWLLATLSFIATLGIYHQTKPGWRDAAAYLQARTKPGDIILTGPLWDEGRFIGYYYRGPAQLLTPAALVINIQGHAETLRTNGGRVWAVNRFAPAESPVSTNVEFSGVVISEPQLAVYEAELLTQAAIDLAAQAVEAAYPWAAKAEAQGVLNPDPRTARAAALRAWGDALFAAGRPQEALAPYQIAVDIFPGWANGFIALAETQEAIGNLPAAADAYRRAVTFNRQWQGPSADKAARLVEAGQWAPAIEMYHQIMDD